MHINSNARVSLAPSHTLFTFYIHFLSYPPTPPSLLSLAQSHTATTFSPFLFLFVSCLCNVLMAGNNSFLPVSRPSDYTPLPDGSHTIEPLASQDRRRSKKMLAGIVVGLFLFIFIGAIVNHSKQQKVFEHTRDDNTSSDDTYEDTVTPGILNSIVSRGSSAGVSEKTNRILARKKGGLQEEFSWNNSMLSWQRTAFHFQPEKNWMNDPNGPLLYKGLYHFFYQYNPNAAVWGDIVWGHAVSEDLIHWQHLPLAMVADQWYDRNGVWTGSATILPDGKIVMLYTGSTNESVQVQNLAYPADYSDPLLVKWVKYPGNPVLVTPPGIHFKDFRDPTTAWLTSEGNWRITIGSKINKTGIALVYDTVDFINYNLSSQVLHGVPGTGMWECVDFYPVSKVTENGMATSANGPHVKHVVKASLDDDRHDYYALGTYDDNNGNWHPDNAEIDVGIGMRYDYGIFYASKTFYDEKKNRRVLWGWIGESDSEFADVKKGWASLQGIPRTVVLDRKTGSNLLQWPVDEVESLRLRSKDFNKVEVKPGSVLPLALEDGATQLDIVAEFELDKNAVDSASQDSHCGACGLATHRGALGPFGLLVLADEIRSEQTPVFFYVVKGDNGTLKTFFCTDQSRSSIANDVNKQIFGSYVPVLEGEKFTVRMLVDHSIIESFAQGGRTSITSRVYPTRAIYGAARLFLFNNATKASVTASVKIWEMNSAFIRPYPDDQHPRN